MTDPLIDQTVPAEEHTIGPGLSPAREAWLHDRCVCGHERRRHHGFDHGPCISGVPDGGASVCPCQAFTATLPA